MNTLKGRKAVTRCIGRYLGMLSDKEFIFNDVICFYNLDGEEHRTLRKHDTVVIEANELVATTTTHIGL